MGNSALRFLFIKSFLMVSVFSRDVYVTVSKTWSEAQEYCRTHYTDLSTINSQEEDNYLFKVGEGLRKPNAWIGLYKDSNDIWMWSSGTPAVYFNWISDTDEPDGPNRCVTQTKRGWQKKNCETGRFNFYCFEREVNLVKENLTWEKAMEHCRDQQTELVSLTSEYAPKAVRSKSLEAQTARIWTGLRYLGNTWLWVGGGKVTHEMWAEGETPHCPALERHCGVVSVGRLQWESWDCADKLNFICH